MLPIGRISLHRATGSVEIGPEARFGYTIAKAPSPGLGVSFCQPADFLIRRTL